MTKETLKQEISQAVFSLIKMAEKYCWNKIPKECLFILSEIKNEEAKNIFEQRIHRIRINDKKVPISFDEMILEVESMYENLYDINLYIYHAKKGVVIIEIQYFSKSYLEEYFFEKVKFNEPMLHYKLEIPPYHKKDSDKFDVNWVLGGIKHSWKMFWWRRKMKRRFKKH